ncbi:MAG: helix-turn-helix domain-containing protein [Bacteroidota bacterium]|nr:helix-turn-helix domain-containing protein [Bacteroidota bacterium]
MATKTKHDLSSPACTEGLTNLSDALYVIGGKWKLRVIIALRGETKRFNELQRSIPGISARVLSNELKELELNGFVERNVFTDGPVIVEYELTDYSDTLSTVLEALSDWGAKHRAKIKKERR